MWAGKASLTAVKVGVSGPDGKGLALSLCEAKTPSQGTGCCQARTISFGLGVKERPEHVNPTFRFPWTRTQLFSPLTVFSLGWLPSPVGFPYVRYPSL